MPQRKPYARQKVNPPNLNQRADLDATSMVDKLLKDRLQREEQKKIAVENQKEWQGICNKLFATPNGQYFLKLLIKFSGIFEVDDDLNPANMLKANGRKEPYLKLIRPYLDPTLRKEIE